MTARPERTALLLVDLQRDFLARPGLVPDAARLCAGAAVLLARARERGIPVAHAHTVTRPDGSDRMPHWQRDDVRQCVEGTPGAEPPRELAPAPDELVVHKQYYSAFADPRLENWLRDRSVRRLVVAGIYLHGCVRSTVLDAYERGYEVWVADDAVGTTAPAHGELTRAWLGGRAASFRPAREILAALAGDRGAPSAEVLPVAVIAGKPRAAGAGGRLVRRSPCRTAERFADVPLGGAAEVAPAARAATEAGRAWACTEPARRGDALERWAAEIEARRAALVDLVVREVGKPRRFAEEEIGRAVAHARVAAELARAPAAVPVAPGVSAALRPVGVVGLVTPWNNPLAIPVGKVAPALAFGNGVVLKPAPEASEAALALLATVERAGFPLGLVNLVLGGAEAARALCRAPGIAAISVTGSLATGRAVAALAAEAMKPIQAELGGNNAAIVLADADLDRVVPELVRAAFGFAGQRCTAVRRFVVERGVAARFEARAADAVRALRVGDPDDPSTEVGPLISVEARDRVAAAIARACAGGARLVVGGQVPPHLEHGAWLAPALLADVEAGAAIAQEETFGPVAVVQVAEDLEDALAIANGVAQGLVMSVHTRDPRARARVLEAAEAGIVQLAAGPLAVHPRAPFAGWKASGLGPPEHGSWDAAFYARTQAVYEEPC